MSDSTDCHHCFHLHKGPVLMVVPEGHIVVKCCKCPHVTTVHAAHADLGRMVPRRAE